MTTEQKAAQRAERAAALAEQKWAERVAKAVSVVSALQAAIGDRIITKTYAASSIAEASQVKTPAARKHIARAVEEGQLVEIDPASRFRLPLPGAPEGMPRLYLDATPGQGPHSFPSTYGITTQEPEKPWGLGSALLITTPAFVAETIRKHTS